MARYDFRTPRLFLDQPLAPGASVSLDAAQTHYLVHVLRQKPGDAVLVFNGRDGEWRARLDRPSAPGRARGRSAPARASGPA